MTKRTRDQLDQVRGECTRSEWLRNLVDREIGKQYDWFESLPTVIDEETRGVPLPKATAPVPDARKSGGMITENPKPAKRPKIVPEKKHWHRFERKEQVGHTMRGELQVPIYRYECRDSKCDVSEERP